MKIQLTTSRRSGFTYLTVAITMVVVGFMLAAYIKMVSVQNQLTMRSQTWNRSVPVLEAGVEEAMAHLNKNGTPDSSGNLPPSMATDGWTGNTGIGWTKFAWLDQDFYFVAISPWVAGSNPSINSTGYVMHLPAYAMNRPLSPFLATVLEEMVASRKYSRRIVQCGTTNNPVFSKGLLAKGLISLNGNRVTVDSFDSRSNSTSTDGRWVVTKRRANGDIATNGDLIEVGNANIYGRVATGPNGTFGTGPNCSVGDLPWVNARTPGIKPGWESRDMNVEIPDVIMPAVSGAWLPAPAPVGGVLTLSTPGASYRIPGTLSGQVVVAAPNVSLRIDGGMQFPGGSSQGITINSNASITIYLNCASAVINGLGVVNTLGTAKQCAIYGTPNLKSLEIGGNGEATCVVYAPQADVKLHGGGTSDQDFSGAIVGKTFAFTGHYNIHYDEALGKTGFWRGYSITSWNEK